jgi:hypothetical protein
MRRTAPLVSARTHPRRWGRATFCDRGDFLAFVGNLASRHWVRDATHAFRAAGTEVPAHGIAAIGRIL